MLNWTYLSGGEDYVDVDCTNIRNSKPVMMIWAYER